MNTVPFPPAPRGDSYRWRATFPDASYLVGAPGNVIAQIRDSRNELVAEWDVTVDGAALVLELEAIDFGPGIFFTDVQVGTKTYIERSRLQITRGISS